MELNTLNQMQQTEKEISDKAVMKFVAKLKAEFRCIYNDKFSNLLDGQIDRLLNSSVNSDVH